jgi:hypothetical protein
VLAVLAAIPVISGCGSDDVLSSDSIAQAAKKTTAKGGTRVAINQTITLPGQSPITMSGSGIIDPKTMRGRLQFDLSKLPGLPNDIGSNPRQELIFERFTMYIRSPVFAASLPRGKRWLKIDLAKAGKAAGIDLGALAQQGQDPTQAVSYLKAASGDVKRVGEEDVRGVPTTHYRATIDFRRYPDTVPAKDRAAVRATIEQVIKLSGSNTAPMEVWIGKDDVVRRVKQTIRTLVAPGTRGTINQQVELFDFGTPVDVTLPPAREIQDSTDLAAAGVREATK